MRRHMPVVDDIFGAFECQRRVENDEECVTSISHSIQKRLHVPNEFLR